MATITTAATQTPKHPYFMTERKVSKFQSFIRNPRTESLQDIAKKAREWVLEQGDKISIVGHAWSCRPCAVEERKGPSSYDDVLTITYVENSED